MKKIILTALVTVLLCASVVGTTFAWLVDVTETKTNTFTAGNIKISFAESTSTNKRMLPGAILEENPTVTVYAESEACWLFAKIEKSDNFDTFLTYAIAEGWTALDGKDGVYYREVADTDANQVFGILLNNQVEAKTEPTKEHYDDLSEANFPALYFTMYAVQREGMATAVAAWAQAEGLSILGH